MNLISTVLLSLLGLFSGCATIHIPTETNVGTMSRKMARRDVIKAMHYRSEHYNSDIRIGSYKMTRITSGASGKEVETTNLSDLTDITGYTQGIAHRIKFSGGKEYYVWGDEFKTEKGVERIANAFFVLKKNAIKLKEEEGQFDQSFNTSLNNLRAKAEAKTPLPEEAIRYKIQAEGSVKDKAFEDAADYYRQAIKLAPWWAAGHFNLALVQAEIDDFELAINSMKRYLQLMPKAANARAAQDKIYDWERQDKNMTDSQAI